MWDLAKSVSDARRVQAVLIAWLPPVLLSTYAFLVFIAPSVAQSQPVQAFGRAANQLGVNSFLFCSILALIIAALGYMLRHVLYRLLEGYIWPSYIRDWRVRRAHLPQRRWLETLQHKQAAAYWLAKRRAQLEQATRTNGEAGQVRELEVQVERAETRLNKWEEKLVEVDQNRRLRGRKESRFFYTRAWHRPLLTFREPKAGDGRWEMPYPAEQYLMPTKVGNAFRKMETYGVEKFGLDSQILWYELYGDAPESLKADLDDCELQADTFLAALYSALAFTTAALVSFGYVLFGAQDFSSSLIAALLAGLGISFGSYRGLLGAVNEWGTAVRALVNIGKEPLRKRYGLRSPTSIDDEKEMWTALTSYVWYGGRSDLAAKLDAWRSPQESRVTDGR